VAVEIVAEHLEDLAGASAVAHMATGYGDDVTGTRRLHSRSGHISLLSERRRAIRRRRQVPPRTRLCRLCP
jgi:hypothetical protein